MERNSLTRLTKTAAASTGSLPWAAYVVATITRRQKSLALIRAREVATNLSMPMVVFDPEGRIVFYNAAAETLLGDTFENAGELSGEEWTDRLPT